MLLREPPLIQGIDLPVLVAAERLVDLVEGFGQLKYASEHSAVHWRDRTANPWRIRFWTSRTRDIFVRNAWKDAVCTCQAMTKAKLHVEMVALHKKRRCAGRV